jgi:hypothetical protein
VDAEHHPGLDIGRARGSGEDGVIPSASEEYRRKASGLHRAPKFLLRRNDTKSTDRSGINQTAAPTGVMRRGFLGAVAVSIAAAAIVGLLWSAAREAPSAGRDPNLTPPMLLATRAPQPTSTPAATVPTPTPASIS